MSIANKIEWLVAIVRTIAAHVRADAINSWSYYHFDFRSAVLEAVDLSDADFFGEVNFTGASFILQTTFEGARFDRSTFEGAKFRGEISFRRSAFFKSAIFGDAIFDADATFDQAKFRAVTRFNRTEFKGQRTSFTASSYPAILR
jgi:uncharacterized protein YjbI with pentapeptide repeats